MPSLAQTKIEPSVEAALRGVPEGTTRAWSQGDPEAFAAHFARNAKVVIAGNHLQGHAQVRAFIGAAFSGPFQGTRVVSDPVSVEILNADTALIMTEGGVLLPGENEVSAERAIWGTWLLAKEDGEWRIRAYHSSPVSQG